MAQLAEGSPSMHERPCCIAERLAISIFRRWRQEDQRSMVRWIKFKFKAFLSYMRPCFKNRNKARESWSRKGGTDRLRQAEQDLQAQNLV